MADRHRVSSGSEYERCDGYSRAVVEGDGTFVPGTTGFEHAIAVISGPIDPRMKGEIEVTARRPTRDAHRESIS